MPLAAAQKIDVFRELLDALPKSTHVGVNYDPSNTIIAGEDPAVGMEHLRQSADFLRKEMASVGLT